MPQDVVLFLPKGSDMDVVRAVIFFLLFLFVISCGKSSSTSSPLQKTQDDCANTAIPNQKLVHWKNGTVTKYDLSHFSASTFSDFVKRNQKNILLVEDNFRLSKPKPTNISLLGWGGGPNWGIDTIHAAEVWSQRAEGENVLVAIIDSGIDTNHPQLKNQLYTNPREVLNGLDDDGNGLIDDVHGYDFSNGTGDLTDDVGHGTHVAGIIAADVSQGSVQGVAPKAKIIIYDFLSAAGDGSAYDAIAAIQAAGKSGARVINASWGGPACSRSLELAIGELAKKNVLFVAAAGNDSENIDQLPSYPASYNFPHQITVGAMTYDEYTAGFSNYGDSVHLVAPGANILSTYPLPETTAVESGTSMAAPFVTGAAALLISAFPQASAVDIKMALIQSAHKGSYPVFSRGALDVAAAYKLLSTRYKTVP